MEIKKILLLIAIISSLLITSCTIHVKTDDDSAVETAVAQTVLAQKQNGSQQYTATVQVLPTITALPTITPKPGDPTNTPRPCNKALAIDASETYPDNTEVQTGTDFVKSWRLENIGTCTWNANYRIAFSSGDQMGGPAYQLLGVNVAPGERVDIAVDLTVPNSTGTYKGTWKLQDDEGEDFGTVWVQIKAVAAPVLPPAVAALSLHHVAAEGGSVRSDGSVMASLYNVGDLSSNGGSQVFASFNISGIPAGATITEVEVDFSDFDMLDDPFNDLGCLRAYVQNYNNMDASDYFVGAPSGAIGRWCSSAALQTVEVDEDFKNALQDKLGDTRFQIRLQFNEMTSDNDNTGDMVRFGDLVLHVTYELP